MKNVILVLAFGFGIVACGPKEAAQTENATEEHENHDGHSHAEGHDDGTEDIVDTSTSAYASVSDADAKTIVDAYLELKDALVKTSFEAAKSAAVKLEKVMKGKNDTQELKGIYEDATHIMDTDEMEHMREHFDLLSQNIYDLAKEKNTGKTLYKQFCPMAFDNQGAFWISAEKEVLNPYFGDKMLKCGKVEETIAVNK